ncbi:MAG: 30S ribosomal protein S9 [bacterium]|nr:30S ribosomal protein S9 [bacterium]
MQYISTIGRRKTAIASIKLFTAPGTGKVEINGKPLDTFFPLEKLKKIVCHPLETTNLTGIDISARVSGGGVSAQAESLRLAIARALIKLNPDLRPVLRAIGYLTCDSRNKERKKYGLKRARRAPQWQKR